MSLPCYLTVFTVADKQIEIPANDVKNSTIFAK
jgi:hypothetical protein